eukprot:gnl/TRDRNA2_/TRDRNA2_169885_c0_seq1.p1 gnl/TRDRNA2_/TRDRNA2_169885_c0~~gnl/TRDRNA2_/TRDRNA2_169885_c0_seq1.p1  ORF type:complete len:1239 (+),score=247.28 gnl/TRDRNA2_/TRDRNA2_169885_c0_seq1:66-3782(+)
MAATLDPLEAIHQWAAHTSTWDRKPNVPPGTKGYQQRSAVQPVPGPNSKATSRGDSLHLEQVHVKWNDPGKFDCWALVPSQKKKSPQRPTHVEFNVKAKFFDGPVEADESGVCITDPWVHPEKQEAEWTMRKGPRSNSLDQEEKKCQEWLQVFQAPLAGRTLTEKTWVHAECEAPIPNNYFKWRNETALWTVVVAARLTVQEQAEVAKALIVTVVSARGLRDADWSMWPGRGSSDPYCTFEIKGKPNNKFKTPVVKDELNPTWNHTERIDNYVLGDVLEFKIFDEDVGIVKNDDLLGRATLTSAQLSKLGFQGELPLSDAGKGKEAFVTVRVQVVDVPTAGSKDVHSHSGPVIEQKRIMPTAEITSGKAPALSRRNSVRALLTAIKLNAKPDGAIARLALKRLLVAWLDVSRWDESAWINLCALPEHEAKVLLVRELIDPLKEPSEQLQKAIAPAAKNQVEDNSLTSSAEQIAVRKKQADPKAQSSIKISDKLWAAWSAGHRSRESWVQWAAGKGPEGLEHDLVSRLGRVQDNFEVLLCAAETALLGAVQRWSLELRSGLQRAAVSPVRGAEEAVEAFWEALCAQEESLATITGAPDGAELTALEIGGTHGKTQVLQALAGLRALVRYANTTLMPLCDGVLRFEAFRDIFLREDAKLEAKGGPKPKPKPRAKPGQPGPIVVVPVSPELWNAWFFGFRTLLSWQRCSKPLVLLDDLDKPLADRRGDFDQLHRRAEVSILEGIEIWRGKLKRASEVAALVNYKAPAQMSVPGLWEAIDWTEKGNAFLAGAPSDDQREAYLKSDSISAGAAQVLKGVTTLKGFVRSIDDSVMKLTNNLLNDEELHNALMVGIGDMNAFTDLWQIWEKGHRTLEGWKKWSPVRVGGLRDLAFRVCEKRQSFEALLVEVEGSLFEGLRDLTMELHRMFEAAWVLWTKDMPMSDTAVDVAATALWNEVRAMEDYLEAVEKAPPELPTSAWDTSQLFDLVESTKAFVKEVESHVKELCNVILPVADLTFHGIPSPDELWKGWSWAQHSLMAWDRAVPPFPPKQGGALARHLHLQREEYGEQLAIAEESLLVMVQSVAPKVRLGLEKATRAEEGSEEARVAIEELEGLVEEAEAKLQGAPTQTLVNSPSARHLLDEMVSLMALSGEAGRVLWAMQTRDVEVDPAANAQEEEDPANMAADSRLQEPEHPENECVERTADEASPHASQEPEHPENESERVEQTAEQASSEQAPVRHVM